MRKTNNQIENITFVAILKKTVKIVNEQNMSSLDPNDAYHLWDCSEFSGLTGSKDLSEDFDCLHTVYFNGKAFYKDDWYIDAVDVFETVYRELTKQEKTLMRIFCEMFYCNLHKIADEDN